MVFSEMNLCDKWYRLALPIGGMLAVLALGVTPKSALANLSVSPTTTSTTLQGALQGANVTISNVTLNQGTTGGQIGTFAGGTTGGIGPTIGIDNGVVIITGDVNSALGPNNNAFSTTGNASDTFFDADLGGVTGTSLACKTKAGTASFQCDTAVLEFDVVPTGSVLSLNFVFASEEYNEYVCSVFNDGLAIFVQGPGITGKQNIATVGGSRISINNINNGITGLGGSGTCSSNSSFFVQNTNITLSGGKASDAINAATYTNTQFDGFTKPLQSLIPVIPGQTYHIKIAIADVGDFQLDSGVFIDNITSYNFDFGDAPDSYGTTIPSSGIPLPGGARHSVGSDIYLGSTAPDAESNGTPATLPNSASGDDASGSDDEDAFSSDIAVSAGATSFSLNSIPVHNTVGAAKLMGWIDFNKNGVFDSGELATATVSSGATTANLSWAGLSGITAGTTYARFRLTTDTNLTSSPSPIGLATDGEVEDYRVIISSGATVSGTVFDDADGSKIQNGTEAGANGGGLNAVLVDSTNKVIAISTVAANGTYAFSNVNANASYTVQITTATATIGSAPPAITLPSNWVSTGENLSTAIDGTVDSKLSISVATSNITGANFGIEQLPDTTAAIGLSLTNLGGTTTVQVPNLAGTDPEDGALGTGKHFKILTLPTNGKLYYNGIEITTAGFEITSYDPTLLKVDPNDGALTVSFTYAAVDAANQVDLTPATVSMPFVLATAGSDLTISKTHTGNFTVGSTGTYSMSVGNSGGTATSGTITFTDTLPTGLTVNGGAAGAVTLGGTNGANWTCNSNAATPQVITCTSSTVIAALGSSVFTFPVSVGLGTAIGTNSITNTASVSGGGQTNTANDSSSDPTTVLSPDLTIAKTHTGNFTQGGTGAYSLTVGNSGTAATSGTITVVDTLPTGLSIAAGTVTLIGTNAANWSCNAVGQAITCTSSNAIAISGSSTFGFNVAVASNASASVTNNVSISGGNEATANNGNSSATDPTTVSSISAQANVLLVKRITAINGDRAQNPNDSTPINAFVDDALTNDNNTNWPNPKSGTPPISNFLQGVIDAGKVKPGDTVEYTIYFLNADVGNANGVKICDRLTGSQSLLLNAYGTSKDIQIHKGDGAFTTWLSASAATSNLTSVNDIGDRAEVMTTASAPNSCHLDMTTGGATDTGTLVIDITGTGNANQPDWSPVKGSTGAGTADSYGFIRFTTTVNP
jgi:uncharacterized repeat protein (TIGR01451 family)